MEFCIRLALCFLIAHYFSVVASGDFLYLFYGEYGYPGTYDSLAYDPAKE